MRRVLAALRDNTNDEESSAAASNSKAATQATLRNVMEPDEEANFKANWQAKNGGHGEEASWATKRKPNHTAHQGGGTCGPQVLTADEEANFGANWQADKGGYPSTRANKLAGPPRRRPTTQPTRVVGHAAPKGQRRCLVPPW